MIDENKKIKIAADLQSLGFSDKETFVYMSLLRLGEVGTSKIIRDTGLHGQFVYDALNSLERKGLVSHLIKRGRKKFKAKNPQMLTRQAERQRKIAEDVATELSQFMVLPPEQEYEVVQGKEAFQTLQLELHDEAKEGSEVLVISGAGDSYMEIMGDNIVKTDRMRAKKGILIRYVGSIEQKDFLRKSRNIQGNFEFRMLPGLFTGKVNTNIWDFGITFNIFGDPVTCFLIRNPLIAGSYRQFFETLWRLGK